MRQYIVNLTNQLIGKNKYHDIAYLFSNRDEFIKHVKCDLYSGDVRNMKPETLGRIMCSFDLGDVMSVHPGREVTFSGDCDEMLRELVALCLAHAISLRLDVSRSPGVPAYRRSTAQNAQGEYMETWPGLF